MIISVPLYLVLEEPNNSDIVVIDEVLDLLRVVQDGGGRAGLLLYPANDLIGHATAYKGQRRSTKMY